MLHFTYSTLSFLMSIQLSGFLMIKILIKKKYGTVMMCMNKYTYAYIHTYICVSIHEESPIKRNELKIFKKENSNTF